ncbi:hypothetical protein ACODT3_34355 [Streptomyces sp. 4.24]|uniref:hypothetical protein n=1 Tax=Streptomyces tritrimontium TaxID=3406573 RepID=UPI003BB5BA26
MSDPRAPQGEDDEYSATVLGSHWISGPPQHPAETKRLEAPDEDETPPMGIPAVDVTRPLGAPGADITRPLETPDSDATRPPETSGGARPDRVEGSVLRFGPGVTAALPLPFPVAPPPRPPRRRGEWRRYTLAAVILLAVLVYLGWQRYGPALEVRDVAVTTGPEGPGCDATADVVAVVRTNGRPGVITYRWLRSDGTRSEQLTERVPSGRHEARLHLLWTFQGAGTYPAKAELQLVSPDRRTASAEFIYRCRP